MVADRTKDLCTGGARAVACCGGVCACVIIYLCVISFIYPATRGPKGHGSSTGIAFTGIPISCPDIVAVVLVMN